jgi:putative transposase
MELFHVLNRGVDGRPLFSDDGDRVRFIHSLYEFNDAGAASKTFRTAMDDFVSRPSKQTRDTLVAIHGGCLVDNHYHLLIEELVEGGLSQFLRKVNIGYAKFYNEKHRRTGTLFQGRTKRVAITSRAQFLYILHYIHLNALDCIASERNWRLRDRSGIRDAQRALERLREYRWSSYRDYIGERNFPSVFTTEFFEAAHGSDAGAIADFLKDSEEPTPELTLE